MFDVEKIFSIKNSEDFNSVALEVFNYQFENCQVYRSYCDLLYIHKSDIKSIYDIPFLPITFFKSHKVISTNSDEFTVFESSGTTGSIKSKHYVSNLDIYHKNSVLNFENLYGSLKNYNILALLPSYIERGNSSLIYMMNEFMKTSNKSSNGFYLDDFDKLYNQLLELESSNQKTLLVGVSFALLDFIDTHQMKLKNTVVMETGGMKGRRKELIREELHSKLKNGFGVSQIHSEYGMTELLSQSYAIKNGVFKSPNWQKVLIRDTENPLHTYKDNKKSGAINVIDLANINSCSFIATQDLGKKIDDNSFSVLGRFDNSDVRGCNLMVI